MNAKKSERANLEKSKTGFILMGFIMSLTLIYVSLEWGNNKMENEYLVSKATSTDEPVMIPVTMPERKLPPPPPAPKVVEEFRIVEKIVENMNIEFEKFDKDVNIPVVASSNEPVEIIEDPLIWVEQMPEFNGNVGEFLSKAIRYPVFAIEIGLQGKVYCEFVVNKDGSIVDVKVIRGVDKCLDDEAIRVVKLMPNWKPGRMNGKPVRVKYTLPVHFRLM